MGLMVLLAFAAGFLLVFGLNLLYSELQSARNKARREQEREESRNLQVRRARLAVQHRDLYEMAATTLGEPTKPSISERIELYFEQAGMRITATQLTLVGLSLCLLAAIFVGFPTRSPLAAAVAVAICAGLPYLYVARARQQRLGRLLAQLPNAFDLIGRMMRAGQTFAQAFQVTANEVDMPLSEEFGYCCDQQRLGLSADAALRDLTRRTGILEIRIFVLAVLVHRQTGGNLSNLMESLAAVIRERQRIKGVVSSLTAEGRMQAAMLISLPIIMLVALTLWNPSYVRELYARPWLLVVTALSMIAGAVWMRRIVDLDY